MKGVKFSFLEAVLSFVYHGEVNVTEADLNNFLAFAEELEVKGLTCGKKLSEGNSKYTLHSNSSNQLQPHSVHEFQSNFNYQPQSTAPLLNQLPAQVSLHTPLQGEHELLASGNNNGNGTVSIKNELESGQLVNNLQDSAEEVDQYAGYEDFNQEGGHQFDLSNYIEKISEGQFKCKICGLVSSQKVNQKRHVESKHFPGLFEYSCDQCGKEFNTKNKYSNHCMRDHSNMK